MAATKKYFNDHFVLFLLTLNAFLAIFTAVFVLLRLSAGHGNSYIVQYRASLGVSAFKTGGVSELISFSVFALLIFVINAALSYRAYKIQRQLSISILSLGVLLIVLDIIVSNALLVLH